jgi:hypothetical protein
MRRTATRRTPLRTAVPSLGRGTTSFIAESPCDDQREPAQADRISYEIVVVTEGLLLPIMLIAVFRLTRSGIATRGKAASQASAQA